MDRQSKPFEEGCFQKREKERGEDHVHSLWLLRQASKHRVGRAGGEAVVELQMRQRGGLAERNLHGMTSHGNRTRQLIELADMLRTTGTEKSSRTPRGVLGTRGEEARPRCER